MKIYKSKWFARFAKKERLSDARLCEAIENAEKGLIDADYGDGVIKQRIARQGTGKSGGYRSDTSKNPGLERRWLIQSSDVRVGGGDGSAAGVLRS